MSLPDMILQRIIVVNAEGSREGPQCPVHTVLHVFPSMLLPNSIREENDVCALVGGRWVGLKWSTMSVFQHDKIYPV